MKVNIHLAGPLRLPPAGREVIWEGNPGTAVENILREALGYSREELSFVQVISDGRTQRLAEPLWEDGKLLVMLRLGGG